VLFSLQPFTPVQDLPDLRVTVDLSRRSNTAALSYAIRGPIQEIVVPAQVETPLRKGGLWEETCLEVFLAVKGVQPYWEVNLSPSGHWNVYRFSAYRQGMQEESAFAALPFRVERGKDSFLLNVELPLDGIVSPETPLEMGISAVIKLRSNQMAYWALSHPGQKPDFHRRESFIAQL
jgi:hypothetical protein